MAQLQLFKDRHPFLVGSLPADVEVEQTDLNLAQSTFVGGLDIPAHRWYKLRPSFSPFLVKFLYERLATQKIESVFDPFSGAGTTVLECKMLGIDSCGIEINPFLSRFTELALDWSASPAVLARCSQQLLEQLTKISHRVARLDLEKAAAFLDVKVPPIHNVLRWWRPDVLKYLLAAKRVLYELKLDTCAYRVLWLALASVCIEVANIKRLHPTLSFYDRSGEHIDALQILRQKIEVIASDLSALYKIKVKAQARVYQGNSLSPDTFLKLHAPVALITSPPYPNRYSYVWETRPHLYMMDLMTTGTEAAQLDLDAPGGTWGTATSILTKGELEPQTTCLTLQLADPIRQLRKIDNLMANYVIKYFNMMDEHFDAMGRVLPKDSRFAYVVGNSRIKGVDVCTGSIFAQVLNSKPWAKVESLIVFRRRIGKKNLYETAVIGDKVL